MQGMVVDVRALFMGEDSGFFFVVFGSWTSWAEHLILFLHPIQTLTQAHAYPGPPPPLPHAWSNMAEDDQRSCVTRVTPLLATSPCRKWQGPRGEDRGQAGTGTSQATAGIQT